MDPNSAMLPHGPEPSECPPERLISIPFFLLRASTAAGAVATGLVQTFVFARVFTPERFSIFIVVGAIGYTLWFTDLGLAKILFVNLRAAHLAGRKNDRAARGAMAVVLAYVLLAVAASFVCVAVRAAQPWVTLRDGVELGLFLLYITLNLAWFSLRTLSIAVDLYIFYEELELTRRVAVVAMMLAMLGGLPVMAFLIGANVLWGAVFVAAVGKLARRGALAVRLDGLLQEVVAFFRLNARSIARSSTSALSGVFAVVFPYYFVPLAYGLGAAPIILEVTFRIFRGSSVIYSAACDLTIPAQTRALASHDVRRLLRATALVFGFCGLLAFVGCAVLILAAGPLFHFLLRSAATMPPQLTPILAALLLFNIVQMVAETLLQHTGYFRSLARVGVLVAMTMVLVTALSVVAKFGIVGFLAGYTMAFAGGALCLAAAAIMGPIRAATMKPDAKRPPRAPFTSLQSAPQ